MEPLLDIVEVDSTEMVTRKAVWGPPNNAEGSPSTSDSLIACAVWGRDWEKHQVVVHCDNEAAVAVLNSGYSRDPHIIGRSNIAVDETTCRFWFHLWSSAQQQFPIIYGNYWQNSSRSGWRWTGLSCS